MNLYMANRDEAVLFGNRFLTAPAPSDTFPEGGMTATDAMRLVDMDLAMEGDPQRNLATFVTTWMEPEAQRLIAENLHRNFIDHAEYPISAEIEQRCVRMLADLFHAPGGTAAGCRTQGSSEAIMLGALSLKWKWRERRRAAGLSADRPNLIFGGDVHVVWEKFCRYFDVEPRIVPLAEGKYTIGPEDVEPHLDENTIGVVAVLGTTFTGHKDDVVGIDALLRDVRDKRDLDIPIHVDGASGAFVWPFLYPDSAWDFRLEQVRSINVSGHKYGLVYPGIGWLVFREETDLAKDLVFYENYLGKTDATFTLNFSTGASMVLAQYYNFVRLGRQGYTYVMKMMQENARVLADNLRNSGRFEVIGSDLEQLPLVAFRLAGKHSYDESDIAWQLSAERGWMVPAYTLPPNAERVKIMRALVKETLSREHIDRLSQDITDACRTLDDKGATHDAERAQVKRGTGY
ncbi:glutamate decarboxylase [Streptomyces omiyaensis]|nr:glutamate decarboxylase [Streptomyces omiyaensis]